MMMMDNKAKQQEEKTLVWWHINSCPIPEGCDPRLVGPSIKSALKKSGFSCPVTITAIGQLTRTHTPYDVLRELSSTGIVILNAQEIQTDLYVWLTRNPPPANIMIILGPKRLESLASSYYFLINQGYKILLAYPDPPPPAWLWKSFLNGVHKKWIWKSLLADEMGSCSEDNKQETISQVPQEKCSTQTSVLHWCESRWYCSLCLFAGQSFEDFTTHLESEEHTCFFSKPVGRRPKGKMVQPHHYKKDTHVEVEEEEEKTLVWWHISSCPIPDGSDPRLVGPSIKSALKKSGFSCPVTITAIGKLTHTHTPGDDVLRELSSTGIAIIHAQEIQKDLFDWTSRNPPPANIMLISGPEILESLASSLYNLQIEGYKIFLAYTECDPARAWLWESFLYNVYEKWLWSSLLEDEMGSCSADNQQETIRQEKCRQTGELPPWYCSLCAFVCKSFEDFTTHLESEEHASFEKCKKKKIEEVEVVEDTNCSYRGGL